MPPRQSEPTCPDCGCHHIDRLDLVEVRREIEVIRDTGSIYGLRPISERQDRYRGRRGEGLQCRDCGWTWRGSAGDAEQSPEFQEVLASLAPSLAPAPR